eukprot:jgi/Ulvmu1/3417/UM016_0036.1
MLRAQSVMRLLLNVSSRYSAAHTGVDGACRAMKQCQPLPTLNSFARLRVRQSCSQTAAPASGAETDDAEPPVAHSHDTYNPALAQAYNEIEEEEKNKAFPVEQYFESYANVVTMTGTMSADPAFKTFSSGSSLATVPLRVRRAKTKMIDTFILEAWGPIGNRFRLHLHKGDRVQVHGSLKVDRYKDKDTGAQQTKMSVNVTSAWIIEKDSVPPECDCRLPAELWEELRAQPDNFWDNRTTKVNPKAPDFVHKQTGDALWASSETPDWYLEENAYAAHTGPQLEPVAHGDSMDQTHATHGDDFGDIEAVGAPVNGFQPATGWGAGAGAASAGDTDRWGGSSGSYFGAAGGPAAAAGASRGSGAGDMAALWEEFRTSPQSFWDNREGKRNPRAPDFKHKETGKGLWIESSPLWFDPNQVAASKGGSSGGARPSQAEMDDLWRLLMAAPGDFWDNRTNKRNPRAPDFKHKQNGGALWLNSKPAWVSLGDTSPPA